MGRLLTKKTWGPREVLWARRYSMCQITYSNLQRSGTVANLTLSELERRVPNKRSREVVVLVGRHKTAERHGSAKIVIGPRTLQLLLR